LRLPTRFGRSETAGSEAPAGLGTALAAAAAGGAVVKDEEETLLLRAPFAGAPAWWKLYRVPPRRRLLASLVRSRALREWRALRAVAAKGVPVVAPLAFGESRRLGFLEASLLVTSAAENARDLRALLADPQLTADARAAWLARAGAAARSLHDAGFGHFRMQLRNLLAETPAGAPPRVRFLDLPYACAWPAAAPRAVCRVDLVDLAGAGSELADEDARDVLRGYAADGDLPIDPGPLRARAPWRQKLARIGLYLLAVNTGHRPTAVAVPQGAGPT